MDPPPTVEAGQRGAGKLHHLNSGEAATQPRPTKDKTQKENQKLTCIALILFMEALSAPSLATQHPPLAKKLLMEFNQYSLGKEYC